MPRLTDLQGQQFGEWEVLEYIGKGKWKCQCSCGEIKNVQTYDLTHGKSTSCGHGTTAFKDLTGQKINEWTVLKRQDGKWLCQCSCGEQRLKSGYELTVENCKSCGHDYNKFKDLTGKRFGEWEVLEYLGDRMWKCRCSCGETKEIHGYSLTSGASKSCGHTRRDNILFRKFDYLLPIEYIGDRKYRCLCDCGKEVIVAGGNLVGKHVKSCGCKTEEIKAKTLYNKYGENNTRRINNPREEWQITSLTSKDNLEKIIIALNKYFNRKVTINELRELLDVTREAVRRKIEQWDLYDNIDITSASDQENKLYQFIKSICDKAGYKVETSNRTILSGKEIDIYIPDIKVGFEYNGSFWHSTRFKPKNYHLEKSNLCSNKGIRLIHIFDYEYLTQEQTIKLEKFIEHTITGCDNVIYARNCKIVENDTRAQKFIEDYHLQGYAGSKVNISLTFNNELVGVITFGEPRFNREQYQWELVRLIWKPGIAVVGGKEKLFKYFVSKYKPESVVSYCDISKFIGKSYEELGFKLDGFTSPNYKWVNTTVMDVKSRYQTMKSKLVENGLGDESQTEDEIMESLRYHKVYDCGNLRFIWKRQDTNK